MTPSDWTKQPGETRTLEIDVSPALATGDSAASLVSAHIYDEDGTLMDTSMIHGASSLSGNTVYVAVKGGTHKTRYWLEVKVATAGGDIAEDDLLITVKEKRP